MTCSVMVWLVNPGEYPQQEGESLRASAGREDAPGAATGANIGSALLRMVHGVYEDQGDVDNALEEISENLRQNKSLRISMHGNRMFVVPANRVHYVVCYEVERPKD